MTLEINEVQDRVFPLLRERMQRFGFDRAEIHEGRDASGDQALFIDAFYRLSSEPVVAEEMLRLLTEIRNTLVKMGEMRFPHLRHHFDEKQKVAPSTKRTVKSVATSIKK